MTLPPTASAQGLPGREKGLRGPTPEGLQRYAELIEAGKTPHAFVPHSRDSQCRECALGQENPVHYAVQMRLC